ncbi:MAG: hypothetical protein GF401_01515 [Chitinivibrionales bacterium]|nr:hypothetical protein [Chitinivibrionales bacterium]
MASINYAAKEISVKVVYYGPGLSGKTTNLQVIHQRIPVDNKSNMVSLATETDRTLFFDFLPLDLGKIKGFSTKFQLYTVPGQVYYNATRKLVLRGVDGIVFVADSSSKKTDENIESFQNLLDNLAEYGYQKENIPIIIQYNKRDLPDALPIEQLQQAMNTANYPWNEAVAVKSSGVFESLKKIGKIVIDQLNKKYSRPGTASRPGSQVPPRPRPSTPPPVQPQQTRQNFQAPPPPPPPQQPQQPTRRWSPPANDPFVSGGNYNQSQGNRPQQPKTPPPLEFESPFASSGPDQQNSREPNSYAPDSQQPQKPQTSFPGSPPADQNTFDLESMSGQQNRLAMNTPPPAPNKEEKTELDLEIERYQREIEQKQQGTAQPPQQNTPGTQSSPLAFEDPSQAFTQSQPQQTPQPQQPQADSGDFETYNPQNNENDYDVYDAQSSQDKSVPPNLSSNPKPQAPNRSDDDTPMYFTSVNTERPRKKSKKPTNPREKGPKGTLFSKLFGRKDPDE